MGGAAAANHFSKAARCVYIRIIFSDYGIHLVSIGMVIPIPHRYSLLN